MGYCFVTTEKIKSLGTLTSKYMHNYRKVTVENADPNLEHLNEELVVLPLDEYGKQKTYKDFFKERIESLDYYKNHKMRRDQVYAMEVVSTFSRETDIDIEAWKKENVKWLQKTFNQAGDGKNNIASVVSHSDEPGNVHCHAIIIPVAPNGRLSAKYYTDGYKAMREMQNSYAEAMKTIRLRTRTGRRSGETQRYPKILCRLKPCFGDSGSNAIRNCRGIPYQMPGRTRNHECSCQKKTRSRICGTQTPDGHGTNRTTKSHCWRIGNRKIYGAKRKPICHSSIGYSKKKRTSLKKVGNQTGKACWTTCKRNY